MIAASLIRLLATFFYAGYFPLIPGTFASILGVLLFFTVVNYPVAYIITTLAVTIIGFAVSGKAEKILGRKDAPYIVIDEIAGMLLSLVTLVFFRYDLLFVVIGFLLFRLLDTLKPYPASLLQEKPGSLGIMGDDLIAAVYTIIILSISSAVFPVCIRR